MNVYQFAMDMEMAGRNYYLTMAEEIPGESGKRILRILADEELRHYEYLKMLSENHKVVLETDNVAKAEQVFNAMLEGQEIVGYQVPIDTYSQGIKLEDASIAFYWERAQEESDPEVKVLFQKLHYEEKKHKLLLENILELILEPERQLESPELERPLKQDI